MDTIEQSKSVTENKKKEKQASGQYEVYLENELMPQSSSRPQSSSSFIRSPYQSLSQDRLSNQFATSTKTGKDIERIKRQDGFLELELDFLELNLHNRFDNVEMMLGGSGAFNLFRVTDSKNKM
jgi:hypothetical protein